MKKGLGALGVLLALVVLLALAFVGRNILQARLEQAPSSEVGTAAEPSSSEDDTMLLADYDATVYTDLGEPLRLSDIADGKPLVINFWATWCPYCVDELPDFQRIYAEYGDRVSFAFVDVADGQRERAEDASAWLVEQGFDDLPAFYDTSQEAVVSFGAYALPTTVVVSADGEILTVTPGRIDATLMRGALEQLV